GPRGDRPAGRRLRAHRVHRHRTARSDLPASRSPEGPRGAQSNRVPASCLRSGPGRPAAGAGGERVHEPLHPGAGGPSRGPHRRRRAERVAVNVHLIDGTFELFRHFLSPAAAFDRSTPEELRAVRGVLVSVVGMLEGGATHVGVATDHVIESFRNALWPGYKTGEGLDPVLRAQFEPLEEALRALGVVVWPMVEFEADDALAAAAAMAAADSRVDRVVICTPDKDLAQCVRGDRVVQL